MGYITSGGWQQNTHSIALSGNDHVQHGAMSCQGGFPVLQLESDAQSVAHL
jgi:hypothetical protein